MHVSAMQGIHTQVLTTRMETEKLPVAGEAPRETIKSLEVWERPGAQVAGPRLAKALLGSAQSLEERDCYLISLEECNFNLICLEERACNLIEGLALRSH